MGRYHQSSQIQLVADLILSLGRAAHRDGFQGHYRRGFLHVHRKGRGFVLIGYGDGLFSRGGRIEPAHLVILYSSLAAVAVMGRYHQSSQIQLVADLILGLGRAAHRDGFQRGHIFLSQISINLLNLRVGQSSVVNQDLRNSALKEAVSVCDNALSYIHGSTDVGSLGSSVFLCGSQNAVHIQLFGCSILHRNGNGGTIDLVAVVILNITELLSASKTGRGPVMIGGYKQSAPASAGLSYIESGVLVAGGPVVTRIGYRLACIMAYYDHGQLRFAVKVYAVKAHAGGAVKQQGRHTVFIGRELGGALFLGRKGHVLRTLAVPAQDRITVVAAQGDAAVSVQPDVKAVSGDRALLFQSYLAPVRAALPGVTGLVVPHYDILTGSVGIGVVDLHVKADFIVCRGIYRLEGDFCFDDISAIYDSGVRFKAFLNTGTVKGLLIFIVDPILSHSRLIGGSLTIRLIDKNFNGILFVNLAAVAVEDRILHLDHDIQVLLIPHSFRYAGSGSVILHGQMLLDHQSWSTVPDRIGFSFTNGRSAVGGKAVAGSDHIQYADLSVGLAVNLSLIIRLGNRKDIGAGSLRRLHRSAVAGGIGLSRIVLIERGQTGFSQPNAVAGII